MLSASTIFLCLSPLQSGPVTREMTQFQIDWLNQLQLLHWTAQQQQELFKHTMEVVEEVVEEVVVEVVEEMEEEVVEEVVEEVEENTEECKCDGELDMLKYGHCSSPVEEGILHWCYVRTRAACPDKLHYNNRTISHLACRDTQSQEVQEELGSAEEPEEEELGSAEEEEKLGSAGDKEELQETEEAKYASLEMADLEVLELPELPELAGYDNVRKEQEI